MAAKNKKTPLLANVARGSATGAFSSKNHTATAGGASNYANVARSEGKNVQPGATAEGVRSSDNF